MATVMLRNHGISIDAESIGDTYTEKALEFAGELHDNGVTFDKAYVDRFDGLVLEGPSGTYHFSTPLCGYGGAGPMTTLVILELFEFGTRDEIMPRLDHGGDAAKAVFYR
jgi:hypothetical protein